MLKEEREVLLSSSPFSRFALQLRRQSVTPDLVTVD
jgi:hypothetical protein